MLQCECVGWARKGWHAPQLKRGGEQLDGRVEQLFREQLTRLGGLLVGEHERVVTRSHGEGNEWPLRSAAASRERAAQGEEARVYCYVRQSVS